MLSTWRCHTRLLERAICNSSGRARFLSTITKYHVMFLYLSAARNFAQINTVVTHVILMACKITTATSDNLVGDLGVKVVDSGFPSSTWHPVTQNLKKPFSLFQKSKDIKGQATVASSGFRKQSIYGSKMMLLECAGTPGGVSSYRAFYVAGMRVIE